MQLATSAELHFMELISNNRRWVVLRTLSTFHHIRPLHWGGSQSVGVNNMGAGWEPECCKFGVQDSNEPGMNVSRLRLSSQLEE